MNKRQYARWLRYYREAHAIKSPLKYDPSKKKKYLPIDEDIVVNFYKNITAALTKSDAYLESMGLKVRPPLWRFDNDDPTTWPSSPQFAYGHLL